MTERLLEDAAEAARNGAGLRPVMRTAGYSPTTRTALSMFRSTLIYSPGRPSPAASATGH